VALSELPVLFNNLLANIKKEAYLTRLYMNGDDLKHLLEGARLTETLTLASCYIDIKQEFVLTEEIYFETRILKFCKNTLGDGSELAQSHMDLIIKSIAHSRLASSLEEI